MSAIARFRPILAVLALLGLAIGLAWASARTLAALGKWLGIDTPDGNLIAGLGVGTSEAIAAAILAGVVVLEIATRGFAASTPGRITRSLRPTHRSDLFFALAAVTALSPMIALIGTLGAGMAIRQAIDPSAGWRLSADWPLWLAVPATFVLGDFLAYWVHRALHRDAMWPLHAIHHAARDLTPMTAARGHPIDDFLVNLPGPVVALLLGAPEHAVLSVQIAVFVHSAVSHSSLPFPLWLERGLLAGPRLHRVHHGVRREDHDHNFAILPAWDLLFGTYRLEPGAPPPSGVEDPRYDTGNPPRDLVVATAIWIGGLASMAGSAIRAGRAIARRATTSIRPAETPAGTGR